MNIKKKVSLILILCMALMAGMTQFAFAGTGDAETGYVYQHDNDKWYQNRSPHRFAHVEKGQQHAGYAAATYRLLSGENNSTVNVTYCCDLLTSVKPGAYYKRVNLEEAGYYSEDSAKKIRAILKKGYWSEGPDKTRSIAELQRNSGAKNLTNAEALLATQEAIWHYANSSEEGGASVTQLYWKTNPANNGEHVNRIADMTTVNVAEAARTNTASNVKAVYDYLINLTGEEAKSVIWNFTDNGYVIAAGSGESGYNLIVNFDMTGSGDETDGLSVTVTPQFDSALGLLGELFAPLSGGSSIEAITQKLSDMDKGTDGYTVTFNGLTESQLRSLTGVTVTLDGTQQVKDDVFFYEPEGGRNTAQSFVGLAEGKTKVHREWKMDIDVNDSQTLTVVKHDSIIKGADAAAADLTGYVCINDKTGSEAEYALPVAGATFQLYGKDAKGNVIAIGEPAVSGNDGRITWNLIDTGSDWEYFAVETEAPTGFEQPENNNKVVLSAQNTAYVSNQRVTKQIQVIKNWKDDDNRDGLRPKSVTMEILANGKKTGMTAELNAGNEWKYTFTAPVTDVNGEAIVYTCDETTLKPGDGYTPKYGSAENGNIVVTNVHDPAKKSISVEKVWIDGNNQKQIRPDQISVQLMANNAACREPVILNEANDWRYTWKDLYEFENGKKINYSVKESAVSGYTTSVTEKTDSSGDAAEGDSAQTGDKSNDQTFLITNTITQEEVSISGTKTWVAPELGEGETRPDVTIELMRNNEQTGKTVTLKDGEKDYEFTGLDKYDENGYPYAYSVNEHQVEGYSPSYHVDNNDSGIVNITNTINQEYISVNGQKTWVDPAGTEHPEITISLYRDGKKVDGKEVTLDNSKTDYSFKDLERYDLSDGHEYVYSVEESEVTGYTSKIDGYNIKNTIEQQKISIAGSKTWKDPEGTEHPDITLVLTRDGTVCDSKTLSNGEKSYRFDNLDVYDLEDGHKYKYAVNELSVDNYTMTKNGDDFINTIKEGKTTISGTKTWIDPAGTEHPDVTIVLLQNGKKFDEKVLRDGETSYSFDVPLHNGDGQLYKYTIKELNVEGYTSKVEGYNVINTIRQEQIMIAGSKSWNVPSGMEVPGVTINLLRDGEVVDSTVIESGSSQYQFSNLDKYDLSDGHEYEYTVMEAGCDGYSDSYDGLSIANTVNQKLISVSGTKIWVAPDDTEYPDITVILNKNGEPYRSVVLADGIVNYTFEGLEAYEYNNDGSVTENEYTISEEPVEGYTSDVNGYDLINISDEIMNGVNDGPDGDGTDKGILGKLLKTGDNMSVVLISIIALLALAGAAAAVFCRHRKLQ